MHAYLITAQPSRWRRAGRWVRVCVTRLLVGAALLLLGLLVLVIRSLRPIVNMLATWAVRTELEISIRTGLPSIGASLGAHITEEFVREFHKGWDRTTKEGQPS
ncbi:hypothetical protein OG730_34890 [Streptomyces sp. NBC_01298]|uniref:hypothetical protein n=1 Tax=Streptomyces sp. NBC_01298 TaxID=2903817 RepID=UPI002E116264|nr:hypothetical protein OG730_34890 [Streptomyces sp. NBC_01298]